MKIPPRVRALVGRLDHVLGQATPLVVGRVAAACLTVVVPMVLARRLSREDFGTYKQFFLVFLTVLLVGQLGLTQSLYYFLPRSAEARGRYIGQTLVALSAIGVAVGCGIAVVPWFGPYRFALAIYCAAALASAPLDSALTALNRIGLSATVYVMFEILRAAGLVAGAIWFGGLRGALWGATLVIFLKVAVVLAMVLSRVLPFAMPARDTLRRQLAYALPFAGSSLLYVAQRQLGQYVVSIKFDAATYAIFTVGAFHLMTVDMIYSPVSEVLIVQLSSAAAREDWAAARAAWYDAMLRLAELFLPMAALFWTLGRPLLTVLFTHKYDASLPVFFTITLEVPVAILALDAVMRAAGETRYLFRVNAARVVLCFVLVMAGIWLLGLPGAAAGVVLAELLGRLFMLGRSRRFLRTGWRDIAPWRELAICAARAALPMPLSWLCAAHFAAEPRLAVLLGGCAYAVQFGGLVLLRRLRARARAALMARAA